MNFTRGSLDCEDARSDAGATQAGFVPTAMCCSASCLSPATWHAWAASDRVELLGALRNGRLVAVTFLGWAEGVADALFNISLPEGRDAATALLIEAAERLSTRGISLLNLGGGVRPGDDVERAKQLFGATARPLLHLKQVFAPSRFRQLCAAAGAETSETAFFPPYHSPVHD
jgi:Acetyltransferase (GNAT) domain